MIAFISRFVVKLLIMSDHRRPWLFLVVLVGYSAMTARAFTERQVSTILESLRRTFIECPDTMESVQFLKVGEPHSKEFSDGFVLQLARGLQEVGIPSNEFSYADESNIRGFKSFWSHMRRQRMAWRGSLTVLLSTQKRVILDYVEEMKERFFTGKNLGIANDRRQDLILRNVFLVLIFRSEDDFFAMRGSLQARIKESMNIVILTFKENKNDMKIWWTKTKPDGLNQFRVANEWKESLPTGFIKPRYLLPSVEKVYSDMGGRTFLHPVMHKPPWNYVTLDDNGDFIEDNGGRDITLTQILADSLNFQHVSVDPAAFGLRRTRGSTWTKPNYTFPGINGNIHRREDFHFYLGDTTQTYTRNSAVDYTFLVLADAGAFVTKAPALVTPSDLVYRPLTIPVWIGFFGCFALVLVIFYAGYATGRKRYYRDHDFICYPDVSLFHSTRGDSIAMCTQSVIRCSTMQSEPVMLNTDNDYLSASRIALSVWLCMVSWVFLPSYSGTLVSFFSSPFYEKPLNTLTELHTAMAEEGYRLGVTFGSSSYGILATGGGIYGEIFDIMEAGGKESYEIDSVGSALKDTLHQPFAVFAGREKLVFDTIRLGKELFHINSEVFFTKYKGTVIRNGSPLKRPFDNVLVRIFETGLLNKITQDEYEGVTRRIGKHGRAWNLWYSEFRLTESVGQSKEPPAISLSHLVGCIFLLIGGWVLSILLFIIEAWNCEPEPEEVLATQHRDVVETKSPYWKEISNRALRRREKPHRPINVYNESPRYPSS